MKQHYLQKFLSGFRLRILALSLLGIGASACGVGLALLSKTVVDMATGQVQGDLLYTGAVLALVILIQLALQVATTVLHVHTSVSLRFRLQTELFEKLLRKDKLAAGRFHSGELVHRLSGDTAIVADGVAEIVPSLLSVSARILFSFAALLMLDWILAVLCLLAGFIMLIAAYIYRKKTGDIFRKSRECEGKIRSFLQETAQNLAVIQAFSARRVMLRLLGKVQKESYLLTIRKNRISIGASVCLYIAMTVGYYAVLGWGAWRIAAHAVTFGTLTATLGLTADIATPFQQLASLFPQYLAFSASAERMEELERLEEVTLPAQLDAKAFYPQITAVEFRDLTFSYGDTTVLDHINGSFEAGKLTAVTGKSGAGKSTLLNLMLGLIRQTDGTVSARCKDGTSVPIDAYRKAFAYVPQDFLLLSGTVCENITLFDQTPDTKRLHAAIQAACMEEEVNNLPQGVDTPLGEGGSRLSGGQRQRMAIARAVYSGADILLLDESTSGLTVETEAEILNALRQTGKTVIVVTHRASAVALCDAHYAIRDGKLIQQ